MDKKWIVKMEYDKQKICTIVIAHTTVSLNWFLSERKMQIYNVSYSSLNANIRESCNILIYLFVFHLQLLFILKLCLNKYLFIL